jgi:FOG: Ankyrin repeat
MLNYGADVNVRTKDGVAPLHMAARFNPNVEVISALLKAGANVKARTRVAIGGDTPLHNAAMKSTNPEVILLLLKAGSDGLAENHGGKTPFFWVENNEKLKYTKAYWALHDLMFD